MVSIKIIIINLCVYMCIPVFKCHVNVTFFRKMKRVCHYSVAVPDPEGWFFLTVQKRFLCFCWLRPPANCIILSALLFLAASSHPWSVCVRVSVCVLRVWGLKNRLHVGVIVWLFNLNTSVFHFLISQLIYFPSFASVVSCSRRWSYHVSGRDQ